MRLAYIVGTYPTPSETFITREVMGMCSLGHPVEIFSLFTPASGAIDGVNYGWPTAINRLALRFLPEAALDALAQRWHALFRSRGIDAVVGHFASLPSTIALKAVGDLPLMISTHARDLYVEADRLEEKIARASAIITCTEANAGYLRDHYPAWQAKIHRIYHGLPSSWLQRTIPARERIPGEPLRLLAVGRLVRKKGFHVLLDACARLRVHSLPFTLAIVGHGPLARALRRQCAQLGLQHHVRFLPWMHEEELYSAFAWGDVLVCPSICAPDGDRDGLPNVILEGMASGLPVIGSRLSGIPEGVADGVSGLLTPSEDSEALALAISCLADHGLRACMGNQAAEDVRRRFTGTEWLHELEGIFLAVLHQHVDLPAKVPAGPCEAEAGDRQ